MTTKEISKALCEPFVPLDIEWRLQSSGKYDNKFWAMALAYVTNRAIMQRLDEVVGIDKWKNEFKPAPDGGIMCGLSIKINKEWITKWDGAENTQVEAVKGGLSNAMKRAAVQWGIGRYLYHLEANFTECSDKKQQGWSSAQTKNKERFYWKTPDLPKWALPKEEKNVAETNVSQKGDVKSVEESNGQPINLEEVLKVHGIDKAAFAEFANIKTKSDSIRLFKDKGAMSSLISDFQERG